MAAAGATAAAAPGAPAGAGAGAGRNAGAGRARAAEAATTMASARPGSRGGGGGSSPRHRRRRAASLLLALPLVLLLFALAGAPARAAAVAPAKGQDADPRPAAAEGTTSAGDRGAAAGGAASTPTSTSATAPRQQQQQQQQPSSSQQSQQQAQASPRYPNPDAPALKFAVINQVQFHLEVVAGAMHVLRSLTSLDVHVYLPAKVLAANWYGFASWMRGAPGVQWRQLKEYDGRERYDLAWFLSPEYHIPYVEQVVAAMRPKVTLLYVHNAHMPEADFARLRKLSESAGVPLTTLAPHVARYIRNRTAAAGGAGGAVEPVWMLPVYPYAATRACGMQDLLDAAAPGGGPSCLKGFSVQGRIESARRDYGAVWRQIAAYRGEHGRHSLASFRLNILGEAVEKFFVPPGVRDVVAVYKNPPYPVFYDVVAHSLALVPMLASPLYYESKFSSTVYSSMITGVPMIADDRFLDTYTMIERAAVFYRREGQAEVDVMFGVGKQDPRETWRARQAVSDLREKLNKRATGLLRGWLDDKGVAR